MMNDVPPKPVLLSEYKPPNWLVTDVHLTFRLHPQRTIVISRIEFTPNPESDDRTFELMGEDLSLRWATIDGQDWKPSVKDGKLKAKVPDQAFTWACEVEINPSANTALEGLYLSNGIYCTQCEAEGFRKITFYPDRPDVMAPFTVRIETGQPFKMSNGTLEPGDAPLPVVLSNGNLLAKGEGWAEWHDPWPKPSYLFALVAGDLVAHTGHHKTAEGRDVELNIWVRPGDDNRASYALDALKRSMVWDEQQYGRNYDLDVFNLVAVDDFNAGAMENKGLNIFNSKYVLASPESATDRDYEFIEGIVAHEYFHNWTGNRITCRDWFQLCLKEGLTVFRDQQFSGDMRSHAVKRIDDVLMLRGRQFREDNGPLAHAVRPESYGEINNFYTATVYEKGAEVIGMLKAMVGDDAYAKALELYFDRHDGQAATIEDWLRVFEDATGQDLGQFSRWYSQAGTPRVTVSDTYEDGTYTLNISQHTPPTPDQPDKKPQVIPIALGLLSDTGEEVRATETLVLSDDAQSFQFHGLNSKPVPSLLRGFSAPVILERETSTEERLLLLAHDTDPFNRWEAGRQLAKDQLVLMVTLGAPAEPRFLDALESVASDDALDPAFRAFTLGLPSEDDIAQTLFEGGRTPDPTTIHSARETLADTVASHLGKVCEKIYDQMRVAGPYSPDSKAAGKRALRLTALGLLTRADGTDRAEALFAEADNMTESLGALSALLGAEAGEAELNVFYDRWKSDPNVLDKWFALQAGRAKPDKAVEVVEALAKHPDFNWKTPNRFRSLIGAFAGNTAGFHHSSGRGYELLANWLIKLDPVNPQTAARLATVFETWRRYDGDRQGQINDVLTRIKDTSGLSRDMGEIIDRILHGK